MNDPRATLPDDLSAAEVAALDAMLRDLDAPPSAGEALNRAILADFERTLGAQRRFSLGRLVPRLRFAQAGALAAIAAAGFSVGIATASAGTAEPDPVYQTFAEAVAAVSGDFEEGAPWDAD